MIRTLAVLIAGAAFAAILAGTLLSLPEPPVRLAPQVAQQMSDSGVTHPVTAVLLNFRGYDTLLEVAVLLVALLGVRAISGGERSTRHLIAALPQPLLQSIARIVVPLMTLVAGYLLWAGSHRPGGAFQAAAVLAAAIILLYLAGLLPSWASPALALRTALVAGFVIFLAIAALPLLYGGTLLQYPLESASTLILTIESGLTLSLALVLAGQFLWLPNEEEEAEE